MPGLARARWRWIRGGADTTIVASQRDCAPVSNSSGMSRTTSAQRPCDARLKNRNARSETKGWRTFSRLFSAAGSENTLVPRAARSTTPSRTISGKALATRGTAAPPFASRSWTAASESCTGTPSRRSMAAAVDLPMAIEPVRPKITIPVSTHSARTACLSAMSTTGSTPNHAAKPGRAWCNNMPSPSTTGLPRAAASDNRSVISGV